LSADEDPERRDVGLEVPATLVDRVKTPGDADVLPQQVERRNPDEDRDQVHRPEPPAANSRHRCRFDR
jgi:hypothetical protein